MSATHRGWGSQRRVVACVAITVMSAWSATVVQAATYRCEIPSAQGGSKPEVRYQGQPCDEGGRALQAADRRTAAQRADTTKATQSTAALGKQLERARQRQERAAAGRPPTSMDAKSKSKVASTDGRTQGQTLKRQHTFTARVPKAKAPASN